MRPILLGILIIIVALFSAFIGVSIDVYNTHIDLKTQIEAQQKANEANFDTMWKKINQVTQVSDEYKEGLKEILASYTQERKKESNQLLMDWTKEAVPTFDSSIYKQINNVIVSARDEFYVNQQLLIDLNREHNLLIQTFPNNIICWILHIEKININVVTSTKTDETFNTGKEDNINIKG